MLSWIGDVWVKTNAHNAATGIQWHADIDQPSTACRKILCLKNPISASREVVLKYSVEIKIDHYFWPVCDVTPHWLNLS